MIGTGRLDVGGTRMANIMVHESSMPCPDVSIQTRKLRTHLNAAQEARIQLLNFCTLASCSPLTSHSEAW